MPDFEKGYVPLWYWFLMMVVLYRLINLVRSALNRQIEMSRTSRIIRIYGAGFWAIIIVAGMAAQIWKAIARG